LDRSSFQRLLAQAGYSFQDSGVPWANHYVVRLSKADPIVEAAWEQGRVPRVAHTELEGQGVIFLRVPGILKARLAMMADQQEVSLNEFCARKLAEAVR
jgi:predicted HicB family RNase H-like nuclease